MIIVFHKLKGWTGSVPFSFPVVKYLLFVVVLISFNYDMFDFYNLKYFHEGFKNLFVY